jgi:hypothetical protein
VAVTEATAFNGKVNAASSLTVPGTIAAGLSGSYMVAHININGSGVTVSGVTWNGTALVSEVANSIGNIRGEAWKLPLPAAGSFNLVFTFSGSCAAEGGAIIYQRVDTSAPIKASSSSASNSTGPNLSVASDANGMLGASVAAQEVAGLTQSATVDGGSTSRWNEKTTIGSTADILGAAATKPGTGGSAGPSWTLNSAANWVLCVVSLNPAPIAVSGTGHGYAFPHAAGVQPGAFNLKGIDYGSSDVARALDYRLRRLGG